MWLAGTRPRALGALPNPEGLLRSRPVDYALLWPAGAIMKLGTTGEPNVDEMLPQHKFDSKSLEAYLNQHLPGFGAEREATLTIAQYRYRRQPLPPAETNLCIAFSFLWPWVVSEVSPTPTAFPAVGGRTLQA